MLESGPTANYFLSVYSPQGYVERFRELYSAEDGWKAYILTGSLGPDVPALISRAGAAMEESGEKALYIGSCCEPGQLAAVAFPGIRVCLIDASAENVLRVQLPSLCERITDLGTCLDAETLVSHRRSILSFSAKYRISSARAYRFLTAAAGMLGDTYRLALECVDMVKLERYASNISRRLFPSRGGQGTESVRYLSAITPDGIVGHLPEEKFSLLYALDDEYGIGKLFLNKLRCAALAAGYDVISCPCPLFPDGKPEHLIVPSLGLAFITTRRSHPFNCGEAGHIHIRRFLDSEGIRQRHPRISFERRASRELINEAVLLLADARASRRMIESIYAEATDGDMLNQADDALIGDLLKLKEQSHLDV